MAGDFECGKSTLIGVLAGSALDNGKGLARMQIFQHNHEVHSGRTSSVSQHNIYFDTNGRVLNAEIEGASANPSSNQLRSRTESELADASMRILSFIDMAGHSKYLKTTLRGLLSRAPDHCLLCVSARRGMQGMTTEHLGVALLMKMPLALAITKSDCVTETALAALTNTLISFLSNSKRNLVLICNMEQLVEFIDSRVVHNSSSENKSSLSPQEITNASSDIQFVPIFQTSSVTGQGLDLLRHYFFRLPPRASSWENEQKQPAHCRVIGSYSCHQADTQSSSSTLDSAQVSSLLSTSTPAPMQPVKTRYRLQKQVSDSIVQYNTSSSESISDNSSSGIKLDSEFASLTRSQSTLLVSASSNSVTSLSCDTTDESDSTIPSDSQPLISRSADGVTEKRADNKSSSDIADDSGGLERNAFDTIFHLFVQAGVVSVGDVFSLGPFSVRGEFVRVQIKSARVNNVPVNTAVAGQTCTVMLSPCAPESQTLSPTSKKRIPTPTQSPTRSNFKSTIAPMTLRRAITVDNLIMPVSYLSSHFNQSSATSSSTVIHNPNSPISPMIQAQSPFERRSRSKTLPVLPYNGFQQTRVPSSPSIVSSDDLLMHSSHTKGADSNSTLVSSGYLRALDSSYLRRRATGLVLLSFQHTPLPRAHWEFTAELLVLNHPSRICVNYEPVVHIGGVKQSARIVSMVSLDKDKKCSDESSREPIVELVNGSKAICRFRFLYQPEYISSGATMLIREGRTRGVGHVITALPNLL